MALLWNVTNPIGPATSAFLKELRAAAAALGVQLSLFNVRDPDEFEGAFAAMTAEGTGAVIVNNQSLFLANRARIVELAVTSRLPTMYGDSRMVHAGDLMSYGLNFPEQYRHAATY